PSASSRPTAARSTRAEDSGNKVKATCNKVRATPKKVGATERTGVTRSKRSAQDRRQGLTRRKPEIGSALDLLTYAAPTRTRMKPIWRLEMVCKPVGPGRTPRVPPPGTACILVVS